MAQKRFAAVALSIIAAHGFAYGSPSEDGKIAAEYIKVAGNYLAKQDQQISDCFNPNSKTVGLLSDFCKILLSNSDEFIRKLNSLEAQGSLSRKGLELCQEIRTYFNAAIGVFKQYSGKQATADLVKSFNDDMERVFSPESAFNNILARLDILCDQAEAAEEQELINVIYQLKGMLQKRKNEWSKKSKTVLGIGLIKRMG